MPNKVSLINIDGLSDVAIKLLDMVEKTVGWIVLPKGKHLDFNEGLEFYKNDLKNESNLSSIEKAAKIALARSELKQYINQAKITNIAINNLDETANPENIDEDWIMDFYDKAKNISTSEFQGLWGKILAEKAKNNSAISKRLLHNLYIMEPNHARTFSQLTRYCFYDKYNLDIALPIIFMKKHSRNYLLSGITTDSLYDLKYLGLVDYNYESGFIFEKKKHLTYMGNSFTVNAESIDAGNVKFTDDGNKLFKLVEKKNSKAILEYTLETWANKGYDITYPNSYTTGYHI